MDISKDIIESVQEIFSTMIMMEVSVSDENTVTPDSLTDSISGIIGFTGVVKGVLAIHLPGPVAKAITANFLGMDVPEINEDVEDAIGEVANMLGGNVKSALSDNGKDIDLSMPSTVSGKQYDFQAAKDAERVVVPFSCESGDFSVELQLQK